MQPTKGRHHTPNTPPDELLSGCLIAYVGRVPGLGQDPPEERIAREFGDEGLKLLPQIRRIEDDLYQEQHGRSRPSSDLSSAATVYLRARYPMLTREAVEALVNQYGFDFR